MFALVLLVLFSSSGTAQNAVCYCSDGKTFKAQGCAGCNCAPAQLSSCSPFEGAQSTSSAVLCTEDKGCRVIGGDCKGNNWCSIRMVVNPQPILSSVGRTVYLRIETYNMGSEDPRRRWKNLDKNGAHSAGTIVDWGDTTPATVVVNQVGKMTVSHVYWGVGKFPISVRQWGDYKWHDPQGYGSCSYQCNATGSSVATVIAQTSPRPREN
jgi:hypothetical protein